LSEAQLGSLDMEALAVFWQSDIGKGLLDQRKFLKRELAFTARFATEELATLSGAKSEAETAPDEYVVVQGVVDLAALMPEEIWIVDFKTDRFPISALAEKVEEYRSQLALYGAALGRVYKKPVTKSWLGFLHQRKIVLL
jgi:ATP-dependent helicase/nuclease subunit A